MVRTPKNDLELVMDSMLCQDLQKNTGIVKVRNLQDGSRQKRGVDERLLKLAKQYRGAVLHHRF